jgi:predicted phage terminase large subunit-like protein
LVGVTTRRREITLETFSEPQRMFWEHPARFRAFIGGVGSGKTHAGCAEIIRQPGRSMGMVVAPTYPMLRDATARTFTETLRPLIADFHRSEMRAELTNGTTVLFRSADDPDRLRGPNLGWFYLDEAALMTQEAWLIMIGRLREAPGRAWVTSTPRGKNWLWETFAHGGEDYAIVRSSSRENPFLPGDFIRSLEASYTSEWLRQEVEGEFVDPAGALFKREWFKVVEKPPEGLFWVRYWDLAASTKTSADYTASAAVAFDHETGAIFVKDMIRSRWEWPDARKVIMQTMQAEPTTLHAIEEALHGLAAMQELRREPSIAGIALRGIKVDKDKLTRALPWAARAEGGKVSLVRGPWISAFLDEACQFDGTGATHDDQVDTVSGGVGLVQRGGNSAVGAFG